MSNSLSAIMPKILARGLIVLREQCRMPRIINSDYSTDARQKGTTVDIPMPTRVSTYDVTPAPNWSSAPDTTPGIVQISLSNWKGASFYLTDKDREEIDRNQSFIPMQMGEAIRAISNQINADVMATYKGIYNCVGLASITPFASTVNAITDARKALNTTLAPRENRRFVMDFACEANALALAQFSNFEQTGDPAVKIEGELGRKFGFDWYTDDQIPTHTKGTASAIVVAVEATAGVSTIPVSATGNGTMVVGDVFRIAGNNQQYTVTAATTVGSAANVYVAIKPGLAASAAAAAAISVVGTHVVNLAFHRDAFALAMRSLADDNIPDNLGSQIMTMADPQTGIVLRLEVKRQYKQVIWEFDTIYGCKLVRPELACRVAG